MKDDQWELIEPMLLEWRASRAEGREPVTSLREVVNAVLYVTRTGIAWRYLPHDFPPHTTVYGYFKEWESDGTTEEIHDMLRDQLRAKKGRRILPTAAIVDSQSVKASPNAPETSQGFDGGKKVKGRKRHIATDTLGLLLVLTVTAACVQDSAGGRQILDTLAARWPSVTKTWVDAGYNNGVVQHGTALGIDVEVVARDKEQKGFVVQPIRWRVEQTFGIMSRYRRLHRDYEALPDRSRSMIHWAMVNSMTNRLTVNSNKVGQYLRPKPPAAA
ncbi:IS5 family transposase [Streptomyces olivoreticuli]|nr:IS5 family transposase [Streptomyces olivoreticuli]WKK23794.1 IS5 family transposase [Streptomyces olivoreticuli]WKK23859.1 IS5 family transposase [Streptomyces olivoreticuli]WKK23882.1 IS5 family transposase [Streptomyces olivoreticuli]WKK23932.1 IS5 family transposase [Streptomyces olivoreticuli]WKK23933.1 IS5 family transposase [Streptomyces olivoreticuli]